VWEREVGPIGKKESYGRVGREKASVRRGAIKPAGKTKARRNFNQISNRQRGTRKSCFFSKHRTSGKGANKSGRNKRISMLENRKKMAPHIRSQKPRQNCGLLTTTKEGNR